MMEVIILIILGAILFFTYNGFATRCPNCGAYKLHKKDKEATRKDLEVYQLYKNAGITEYLSNTNLSIGKKPGYQESKFKCSKCHHSFNRKEALDWLTIANKHGEEIALSEYQKRINL
jgi:predicted RNA-binding Zn-ribbon protein involved in translation (DUF1610 family)